MPSSNRTGLAILTTCISVSYQRTFSSVLGMNPREIPFLELGMNFADLRPGGRTHARQPRAHSAERPSFLSAAMSFGETS